MTIPCETCGGQPCKEGCATVRWAESITEFRPERCSLCRRVYTTFTCGHEDEISPRGDDGRPERP